MEPETNSPPLVPIVSQINPVHNFHTMSLRSILILFYHPRVVLRMLLFLGIIDDKSFCLLLILKQLYHRWTYRDSSVSIVTAGRPGIDSRNGKEIFLFVTASRPAESHQASYPIGTVRAFPVVKRSGSEADHSAPSRGEVKNVWKYTSTPQCQT
jgi:hypothetical protein